MKATEQYFPVVLFIMLYKVALNFKSVALDEILRFDHSNKSYEVLLIMPQMVRPSDRRFKKAVY